MANIHETMDLAISMECQRKTGDRPLAALICLAVDQVLEEYYQHQRHDVG
jgi:hypothetical protein